MSRLFALARFQRAKDISESFLLDPRMYIVYLSYLTSSYVSYLSYLTNSYGLLDYCGCLLSALNEDGQSEFQTLNGGCVHM
jgi:hypothetical protein